MIYARIKTAGQSVRRTCSGIVSEYETMRKETLDYKVARIGG